MANINNLYKQFTEWLDGDRSFDAMHPEVQEIVDRLIAEEEGVRKEDPTSEDVHQGSSSANPNEKKRKKPKPSETMDLIHKANDEQKFTLGPWYIPNKGDAHGEWTDADELQKALWDYVQSGDRDIRLQHNKDIVAGEWVEAMSFPVPVTLNMTKATGDAKEVTYPSGTVFLGVKWNDWAWDLVKANKITGFSIGGSAARVEMGIPADSEINNLSSLAKAKQIAKAYANTVAAPKTDITDLLEARIRAHIAGEPVNETVEETTDIVKRIDGVDYKVVPLNKSYNDKVFNVAGLYGSNGTVGIVRTDGERFWASGSSALANMPFEKAQIIFAEIAKAKQSFGGNRSQAGQYAANIRWGRSRASVPDKKYRESTGLKDGPLGSPVTPTGMALASLKGGAGSLVTHCDLDAVAADMTAAGLKEPTPDMYYKHLTPERQAMWDAAIAEKLDGVPKNPDGPNAYMMGGGGASGKSSAIASGEVNVPNADRSAGPVKAVDVNPDAAKEQIPSYRQMVDAKDMRAANLHHEESAQIAALTAKAGLKQGSDIVVDGVADNGAAKTMGKTDLYRSLGAKRVELHVVTVDIPTALERNKTRAAKTGRLVDENALVGGHKGVSKNFEEYASSGKWDSVSVTDTNTRPPKRIFSLENGKRVIHDKAAYQKFLDKQNFGFESASVK
jgi:hypothetical protein